MLSKMTSLTVLENMKENIDFNQSSKRLIYLLLLVTKHYQIVIRKNKYIQQENNFISFSFFMDFRVISCNIDYIYEYSNQKIFKTRLQTTYVKSTLNQSQNPSAVCI